MTRYLLLELLLTALATLTAYVIVWPGLKERWPGVAKFFVVLVAVGIFLFFHLYYFFTRERFEDVMADFIGDVVCQLHAFKGCPSSAGPSVAVAAPSAAVKSVPTPAAIAPPLAETSAPTLQEPAAPRRKQAVKGVPKPHEFRDCYYCPEMVVVKGGSFLMGSPTSELGRSDQEGPQRTVAISAFAMGKYEVTFAEWNTCVDDGGCKHRPHDRGWGEGRRPVINVSWHDAKEYAAWLSRRTGLNYRLPSEAEWEYAARANTTTRYAFGDTIGKGEAQFSERTLGSAAQTIDVGTFPANEFGLPDMHGNVWEWVDDRWNPHHDLVNVMRGGSWYDLPEFLRSAYRVWRYPSNRMDAIGFRVARKL